MKATNINHLWAQLIVEELVRSGVTIFCLSPGSRSAPLAMAIAQNSRAQALVHFDERGSAFYALGVATATRKPCVVVTTSGTAAANLFPAVIEASKKKLPLIFLTADRPPELRMTGAHQTIDQVKLFGDYVRWQFDLPCPTTEIPPEFILTTVGQAVWRARGNPGGPIHLNGMFREPLALVKTRLNPRVYLKSIKPWLEKDGVYTEYVGFSSSVNPGECDRVISQLNKIERGILVVGKINGESEGRSVCRLAEKLQWPVFADISSGLRLGTQHPQLIHYYQHILSSQDIEKVARPDGVLHLGGRITSRAWYDYVSALRPETYIMVLNHPLRSDPSHQVTLRVQARVSDFCDAIHPHVAPRKNNGFMEAFQSWDRKIDKALDQFFKREVTLTEPGIARRVTELIPEGHALFLSNSMPIRDVDMFGSAHGNMVECGANRGASGIDGIVATAAGFSTGMGRRTTLLIGDLACLHDLNSLIMLRDAKNPMTVIVLNNNGGGIFSFLPVRRFSEFEKYFGIPHHLNFAAAAEFFGLNFARPETSDEFENAYRGSLVSDVSTLIEIHTDRKYNLTVHTELKRIIHQAML